jgi:hypothetical protein
MTSIKNLPYPSAVLAAALFFDSDNTCVHCQIISRMLSHSNIRLLYTKNHFSDPATIRLVVQMVLTIYGAPVRYGFHQFDLLDFVKA